MLIEKEREIGHALYMENRTIWPKIVGKEKKERGEQQKCCKSQQKKVEDSELPTGLQ